MVTQAKFILSRVIFAKFKCDTLLLNAQVLEWQNIKEPDAGFSTTS